MARLLKAFIAAPGLLCGGYYSANEDYQTFLDRYRPSDGLIYVGSPREDRRNYCADFKESFMDYRKAGEAYIKSKNG